ncbi:MAG: aldolase catalytic domain-containing protein [Selenomonadaceae bacterium]|nr:aldolase catalytic domain-containing protein [Selenomonadaceae bacterium]
MSNKIELLDCTLRDGGYVNDWNFGHDKILEVFARLVSSGVEYIEIGFLDERRLFDINRTIMPDTQSANKIFANADKGAATVLAMIDYGTCSLDHLQPCSETFIDGIRVIFKEHKLRDALNFCRQVKALGYKVFAQMVSVTTYTDEALVNYARAVNKVAPFATSMVDTYGLLDDAQLMHITKILDRHVDQSIRLGFHAHNNFQLGYANARAFLELDTPRGILADGTLYGMGKSAGNAPLELLMMFANDRFDKHYDIAQALEAIDNVILDIYRRQYWGYNLFFYLSASARCHPNYVSYLMGRRTLSVKQIVSILNAIEPDKKLLYDPKYAEKIYLDYQAIDCDDESALARLHSAFDGREVLLIGPGNNIKRQRARVHATIDRLKPLVIAVNYAPKDFAVDYIFLTNAKRCTQLQYDLRDDQNSSAEIIATSNVTKAAGSFDYVLNYGSLIDRDAEIIDNSLVMLLKAMIKIGVKKIWLAGFDGYSKRADNYFDVSREYSFAKAKAEYLNGYVRDFLASLDGSIEINFVTESRYRLPH